MFCDYQNETRSELCSRGWSYIFFIFESRKSICEQETIRTNFRERHNNTFINIRGCVGNNNAIIICVMFQL